MRYVEDKVLALTLHLQELAHGVGKLAGRLARDRGGNMMIEYAVTVSGISLGAGGLASVIGTDVSAVFDSFSFGVCLERSQVCIPR